MLEIRRRAAQFIGGCARGGMADTPDLGFDLWPFFAFSHLCLNRHNSIVFIS
jgi:hypothetical protein